jgi:hypothetical protein
MGLLHLKVEGNEVDLMGARQIIAEAVRYLRGDPPELSLRVWRVEWAQAGATFVVAQRAGNDEPTVTATLDAELNYQAGDPQVAATHVLLNQAWGELRVSLGLAPQFHYEWPRPEWMPDFRWSPPLPTSGNKDVRVST